MTTFDTQGIAVRPGQKIIWSASPTPFLENGTLDTASLQQAVDQHVRLGVTGLFVGGTCGEGPLMPNGQRAELVRTVKRLAGSRMHVAAQVSDTSAARVRENILCMQDAGADSVVIAPPWITRFCTAEFVRRYFYESIEAATVPVGIYVLKQPDGSAPDLATWKELAGHPRVRFVKDSSASADYIRSLGELKRKRPNLVVQTGYEFDVISAIDGGYDGALLGTGILIGGMIRRALDALAAGDRAAADAWQKRSNEFLWDLFSRDLRIWLGGLKYALVRLGIFRSEFMHLSYPLADADRARVDAAIEREREFICPGKI